MATTSRNRNACTPTALADIRPGAVGLLRDLQDLQDLQVLGTLAQTTWTAIALAQWAERDTVRQLFWIHTRMKVAAAQALILS